MCVVKGGVDWVLGSKELGCRMMYGEMRYRDYCVVCFGILALFTFLIIGVVVLGSIA